MGTPLKISKLLSPRVLSPNFLNVLNGDLGKNNERNEHVKRKLFLESDQSSYNNVKSPIKIKINECENLFKKRDVMVNTPNKKSIIKNGIKDEKLFNILGRGRFGKVFKGVNNKGRPVAMKLVKKTNYIRENNAINLDHKNIASTLEIFENDQENYCLIIMEYLPNCDTLQNVLKKFTVFSQELLKYACDVCEGIRYCHSNKILHMDLKPSNILIINGTCKICDFGNSVKISESMNCFEHHGTIQYTAPEILLGQMPTEKSDVYSLGIIFWQLKTRKCPYDEIDNIECIIYKVVKCNLRPELDKPTDTFSYLYQHCWSQNYIDRPSVSDILEKLSNITVNNYFL